MSIFIGSAQPNNSGASGKAHIPSAICIELDHGHVPVARSCDDFQGCDDGAVTPDDHILNRSLFSKAQHVLCPEPVAAAKGCVKRAVRNVDSCDQLILTD